MDFVLTFYTLGRGFDDTVGDLISGEFETESLPRELIAEIVRKYYCPHDGVVRPTGDIYAIGVLLRKLLEGGRYCDIPVIGQQLIAIIKKATVADYRQRYQSAAEMLADIEKIQLG